MRAQPAGVRAPVVLSTPSSNASAPAIPGWDIQSPIVILNLLNPTSSIPAIAPFQSTPHLLPPSPPPHRFCTLTQALLHADLHTGSVMVTEDLTVVIDPEFAFYGPMGFDIGCFLGELLLAFFSQDGHATAEDPRAVSGRV